MVGECFSSCVYTPTNNQNESLIRIKKLHVNTETGRVRSECLPYVNVCSGDGIYNTLPDLVASFFSKSRSKSRLLVLLFSFFNISVLRRHGLARMDVLTQLIKQWDAEFSDALDRG